MPRLARLDAPGVLHHVIIRGIERRNIFKDNESNRCQAYTVDRYGSMVCVTFILDNFYHFKHPLSFENNRKKVGSAHDIGHFSLTDEG